MGDDTSSSAPSAAAAISPVRSFFSGGFGGVCLVASGHPLDTIKVRLQTNPVGPNGVPMYAGMVDCTKQIIKKEGPLGLYKGMLAPILGVTPMYAFCFLGFSTGMKLQGHTDPTATSPGGLFTAGLLAGVFTTAIMAPGERIKCLLQIQGSTGSKQFAGPVDCARQLWREGGIASLYRGTCGTLLRDMPASGMYFATYHTTQRYMKGDDPKKQLSVLQILFAGGLAGITNWLVGMPADVLKTRLQTAPAGTYPRGIRDVFAQLMKNEGPLALYKGITPVLVRAFPANAACFLGVEMALRFMNTVWPPS